MSAAKARDPGLRCSEGRRERGGTVRVFRDAGLCGFEKVGGKKGTVPRIDKISTPGHNWVLVNYSPETESTDRRVVGGLFGCVALGAPSGKVHLLIHGFPGSVGR